MGASYKDNCIVLKKTKLKEADLIVTMLDERGQQVRGVAKGARKPGNKRFGARLEPYSYVSVQLYPGRSLESITEVQCIETNAGIRGDLDRSAAAAYASELVEKSTKDGELDPVVFQMLRALLSKIGNVDQSHCLTLALAFQLKALAIMGLRPSMRYCVSCGANTASDDVFSIHDGGRLCPSCAGEFHGDADPAVVDWVDLLLCSTFEEVSHMDAAPALALLDFADAWIAEHMGLRLKTSSFLRMSLLQPCM